MNAKVSSKVMRAWLVIFFPRYPFTREKRVRKNLQPKECLKIKHGSRVSGFGHLNNFKQVFFFLRVRGD